MQDTLGDYTVLGELGQGRMSVVKHVRDNKGQEFALKILFPLGANTKNIDIIKREAKIGGRLFHQNVVNVIKYEEIQSGQIRYHCLVLEYMDGRDLATRLTRGRLSIKDALYIAWSVCKALKYAHSKGVVHRDIKPQNILLGKHGIKVTDFGLASAISSSIASLASVVGTPYYMSPEQAQGNKGGENSDLYSLGIVLYEMLTGIVPFNADKELAVLQMHISAAPTPISRFRNDVPQRLENLVNRAIAKNPKDRFQSAEEMLRALEEVAKNLDIDLNSIEPYPTQSMFKRVFLNWPIQRWEDLITNIGASAVWVVLTSILGVIALILWGARGNTGIVLRPTDPVPLPAPTATSTNTLIPANTSTPTNTPEPTATPTATRTPTATPSPTLAIPTPTNAPEPTATPTPPPPGLNVPQGDDKLVLVIEDVRFIGEDEPVDGAVWIKLRIRNIYSENMEVEFNWNSIIGVDSTGTRYKEYWGEYDEYRGPGNCLGPLGGNTGGLTYPLNFELGPGKSRALEGYEDKVVFLTKDRTYKHNQSGGCELQYRVSFDTKYINITVPVIRYRTATSSGEITNKTWQLPRPAP